MRRLPGTAAKDPTGRAGIAAKDARATFGRTHGLCHIAKLSISQICWQVGLTPR
jgi:hypothetical protein